MAKDIPSLPANIAIFSPKQNSHIKTLQRSTLFTRLTLTQPSQLPSLCKDPRLDESYCLLHPGSGSILIFDAEAEGKDLKDAHHEHFRLVCLALKDGDVGLRVAGCVHDVGSVLKAGFQLEELSDGSVMVVDLMGGEEDDDDDEDEDEDGEIEFMSAS